MYISQRAIDPFSATVQSNPWGCWVLAEMQTQSLVLS